MAKDSKITRRLGTNTGAYIDRLTGKPFLSHDGGALAEDWKAEGGGSEGG